MFNWYLVYTKPKNEDSLAAKFQTSGFEVFNPKLNERRYVRKKLQNVITPLFPSYLFVKFVFPDDLRFVKYTRGVRNVVGSESVPTIVPYEIITEIQKRMEQGVVSASPAKFNPGEEVTIKGGPLKDLEAVFEKELKGMERVSVLLKAIDAHAVVDGYLLAKR